MFDSIIGKANGSIVVGDQSCFRLGPLKCSKYITEVDGFLCIHEKGTSFGFSCRRHYLFDDLGKKKDRSIKKGAIVRSEEVVTSGTTAGLRCN